MSSEAPTKCSLCGSEFTTKASCPLNPDAKPNPWKVGGVEGERGNPLKHPNAVEILRKIQEKEKMLILRKEQMLRPLEEKWSKTKKTKSTKQIHKVTDKEPDKDSEVPEFINKNFTFNQEDDSIIINEPTIVKGKLTLQPRWIPKADIGTPKLYREGGEEVYTTFHLDSNNIKTVKDTVQDLKESDRFGPIEFVGHYNKAGNLVYTSLHGVELPDESPLITDFGRKEGFVAKYKDRLYTFRQVDYGWYPLDAEAPKWEYLLHTNMGSDNRDLDLNKYLIIHTISSKKSADELPKKVDIKQIGIDNLHYRKRPIIGPEKKRPDSILIPR